MKACIAYYSKTGNTRCVAMLLGEYLKDKAQVEYLELRGRDESASFLACCKAALVKAKADLADGIPCDLSGFDLVCFGSPVWAFAPAPVVNAYLDRCSGLEGKTVVLFTTSGGMGDGRCVRTMQALLAAKGVKEFRSFSLPQDAVKNRDLVLAKIRQALSL